MSALREDFVKSVEPDEAQAETVDIEFPWGKGEHERAGEEEAEGRVVADTGVLGMAVEDVVGGCDWGVGGSVGGRGAGGGEAHCGEPCSLCLYLLTPCTCVDSDYPMHLARDLPLP